MALPTEPGARHRVVAATFADRVKGADAIGAWAAPTPVAQWQARDVVRHLIDWLPGFLGSVAGVDLNRQGPSVDDDPVAAWDAHAAAVQALLDDPASSRIVDDPRFGAMPLTALIDRFYTVDVFMHTWDLARATGQDDRLDADLCGELVGGMESMEDMIRASGQFGSRVPVPADADAQTRLIGFIGRDPAWTSAG